MGASGAAMSEPGGGGVVEGSGISSVQGLSAPHVATAHASVTELIRLAIVSGELPAGTRLVQSELARRMQLSTTPIREALRDLTTEGLVDFDPYRGAFVHAPSADELVSVYEMRRLLMPLSVRRGVARITDEELAVARQLLGQLRATSTRSEWVELNRRFHRTLDAASGSRQLISVVGRLADLAALYVNLSVHDESSRRLANEEHARLLEAYEQRDADLAESEMLMHLKATVRAVLPTIEADA
jgi:DNA-binding GntR family transcriptional regulator